MTTPIESENGVLCTRPAWHSNDATVTLVVPTTLLTALQAAWQSDDQQGSDYSEIVTAVRDLFDGQDGALNFLAQVGIETRPT